MRNVSEVKNRSWSNLLNLLVISIICGRSYPSGPSNAMCKICLGSVFALCIQAAYNSLSCVYSFQCWSQAILNASLPSSDEIFVF